MLQIPILTVLILTSLTGTGWACTNAVALRPIPQDGLASTLQNSPENEDVKLVELAASAVAMNQPLRALRILEQSELVSLRYQKTWLDIGSFEALDAIRLDPKLRTKSPLLQKRFERVVAVALRRAAEGSAGAVHCEGASKIRPAVAVPAAKKQARLYSHDCIAAKS